MLDGSFLLNRDASGVAGCEFSIRFTDRGYSAVEPFINWLSTTPFQINKLEANDSKSWVFINSNLTNQNLDVRQKTGSSTSNQVLMVKYRQTKLPVVDSLLLFWLFLFLAYIP